VRPVPIMNAHEESLSSRNYTRLCDLIYATAGIALGKEKKTMLEVRIKRRLKELDLPSYEQYCDYLLGAKGQSEELVSFIDVVTTNKTDFFRESGHFDFLSGNALPHFVARNGCGPNFLIWSAGCSTGEEPYTMAMVLNEFAELHPGFRFKILATDISTTVLKKAEQGIYFNETVQPVPAALKQKYFMRSRDSHSNRTRVVPELRQFVQFQRLNFIDADYGIRERFDAIFCRNVIIYFDRPTQQKILRKLSHHLLPGGFLFVGHAETLHDMDLPLEPVAPALYRKLGDGF
jgi:chemotaxis protein methyltransferase CheR